MNFETDYLSANEAIQIFKISRTTLTRLSKSGVLTERKSGTARPCRVIYSRSELEALYKPKPTTSPNEERAKEIKKTKTFEAEILPALTEGAKSLYNSIRNPLSIDGLPDFLCDGEALKAFGIGDTDQPAVEELHSVLSDYLSGKQVKQ